MYVHHIPHASPLFPPCFFSPQRDATGQWSHGRIQSTRWAAQQQEEQFLRHGQGCWHRRVIYSRNRTSLGHWCCMYIITLSRTLLHHYALTKFAFFLPILLFICAQRLYPFCFLLYFKVSALLCYKVPKNTSDEENNECEMHRASSGKGKTMTLWHHTTRHMNWIITVNWTTVL